MKRKRRNLDPLKGEDRSQFPRTFRELGPTDADRDPAASERGVERLQARLANPHIDPAVEALADAFFTDQRRRNFARVVIQGAAAAALVAVLGIGIYFAIRAPEAQVAALRGEASVVRAGSEFALAQGSAIRSDDLIDLKSGARVDLAAGAGLEIAFDGPAVVRVVESVAGDSPVHEFYIARGVVTARGAPGRPRSVIWRTQFNRYSLKGTVARLTVYPDGETLRVTEGAVAVASETAADEPEAERLVSAGQAIVTPIAGDRAGPPMVRALEPAERAAMEPETDADGQPAAEPPRFKTEDEIRQHFGFLQSLRLKSGRIYRGAIVDLDRATLRFETVDGVFVFTRDEVAGWDDI